MCLRHTHGGPTILLQLLKVRGISCQIEPTKFLSVFKSINLNFQTFVPFESHTKRFSNFFKFISFFWRINWKKLWNLNFYLEQFRSVWINFFLIIRAGNLLPANGNYVFDRFVALKFAANFFFNVNVQNRSGMKSIERGIVDNTLCKGAHVSQLPTTIISFNFVLMAERDFRHEHSHLSHSLFPILSFVDEILSLFPPASWTVSQRYL